MPPWAEVAVAIVMLLIGGGIGYVVGFQRRKPQVEETMRQAEAKANSIIVEAETRSKQLEVDAKERTVRLRDQTEAELQSRRKEIQAEERRLQDQRERLDGRLEKLDRRQQEVENRSRNVDKREKRVDELVGEQERLLQNVAQLSHEEARHLVLERTEKEARQDMARILREVEMETKAIADKRARSILITSICNGWQRM